MTFLKRTAAIVLGGAILCTTSAFAAEVTEKPTQSVTQTAPTAPEASQEQAQVMQERSLYFGTIKEIIRDEEDKITGLHMESESKGECIFHVNEETLLFDNGAGTRTGIDSLKAGDGVYVYHSPAMTMSLPPQTTGEVIIGKIPADQKAPEYITAVSMTANADGSWTLVSAAGKEYAVSADCRIMPYLTRQIVSLEDVEQGSNLLVWSDDQNQAQKLVLFAK